MHIWKKVTLKELGSYSAGKLSHKPWGDSILWGGKYSFLETQDITSSNLYVRRSRKFLSDYGLSKSKLWPKGTLCVSANANVAHASLLKIEACFTGDVWGFIPRKDTSILFVKYSFDFFRKELKKRAMKSTREKLTLKLFEEFLFFKPSFEVQEKVGNILSFYDKLIENHQRQIEILEKLRTKLYKEWFINLRFPNYKKALINGNLPEGWKKANLKDCVSVVTGKRNANFANPNGCYSFFTCGQEDLSCCSYSFNKEAIILSGNGNFHLRIFRGKFDAYQRVYVIEPNGSLLYLSYCAIDSNLKKLFKNSKGSTIKFLTLDMLQDIKVFLPEQEIMKLFNEICEDIQSKIEKLDAKMRKNQE